MEVSELPVKSMPGMVRASQTNARKDGFTQQALLPAFEAVKRQAIEKILRESGDDLRFQLRSYIVERLYGGAWRGRSTQHGGASHCDGAATAVPPSLPDAAELVRKDRTQHTSSPVSPGCQTSRPQSSLTARQGLPTSSPGTGPQHQQCKEGWLRQARTVFPLERQRRYPAAPLRQKALVCLLLEFLHKNGFPYSASVLRQEAGIPAWDTLSPQHICTALDLPSQPLVPPPRGPGESCETRSERRTSLLDHILELVRQRKIVGSSPRRIVARATLSPLRPSSTTACRPQRRKARSPGSSRNAFPPSAASTGSKYSTSKRRVPSNSVSRCSRSSCTSRCSSFTCSCRSTLRLVSGCSRSFSEPPRISLPLESSKSCCSVYCDACDGVADLAECAACDAGERELQRSASLGFPNVCSCETWVTSPRQMRGKTVKRGRADRKQSHSGDPILRRASTGGLARSDSFWGPGNESRHRGGSAHPARFSSGRRHLQNSGDEMHRGRQEELQKQASVADRLREIDREYRKKLEAIDARGQLSGDVSCSCSSPCSGDWISCSRELGRDKSGLAGPSRDSSALNVDAGVRLLRYERECEARHRRQMEQEVCRMRTVELSALRLEESRKARQHLLTYKQELDRLHADRAARLKHQEEAAAERLRRKESEIEKKGFALRQEISVQLRATQQQQRDQKRQWELEQQALDLRAKALDAREARLSEKENRKSQEDALSEKQLQLKMEEHKRAVELELGESLSQLRNDRLALEREKQQVRLAQERHRSLESQAKAHAAANEHMQTTIRQLEAAAALMQQEKVQLHEQLRLAHEVAKQMKGHLDTRESEVRCLKQENAALLEQLSTKKDVEQGFHRAHSRTVEELQGCIRESRLVSQELERKASLLQDELARVRYEREQAVAKAREEVQKEAEKQTQKLQNDLTQERQLRAQKEQEAHRAQVELERLSIRRLQWQQKAQRRQGDVSAAYSEQQRQLISSLSAALHATADTEEEAEEEKENVRLPTLLHRNRVREQSNDEDQKHAEPMLQPVPDRGSWTTPRPYPSRGGCLRTTPARRRSNEKPCRGIDQETRSPRSRETFKQGRTADQPFGFCLGDVPLGSLEKICRENCTSGVSCLEKSYGKLSPSDRVQCLHTDADSGQGTFPKSRKTGFQRELTEMKIEDLERRVKNFIESLQSSGNQAMRGNPSETRRPSPSSRPGPFQLMRAANNPPQLGGGRVFPSRVLSASAQCARPLELAASASVSAQAGRKHFRFCRSTSVPRFSPEEEKLSDTPDLEGNREKKRSGQKPLVPALRTSEPRGTPMCAEPHKVRGEQKGTRSDRGVPAGCAADISSFPDPVSGPDSHKIPVTKSTRQPSPQLATSFRDPGLLQSGVHKRHHESKALLPLSQKSSGELTDTDIRVMLATSSNETQKAVFVQLSPRPGAVSAPPVLSLEARERSPAACCFSPEETGVSPSAWVQNRPWSAVGVSGTRERGPEVPTGIRGDAATAPAGKRDGEALRDLNERTRHDVRSCSGSDLLCASPRTLGAERSGALEFEQGNEENCGKARGTEVEKTRRFCEGNIFCESRATIGPFARGSGLLAAAAAEDDDEDLEEGEVREGGTGGATGHCVDIGGRSSREGTMLRREELLLPQRALERGATFCVLQEVLAISPDKSTAREPSGPSEQHTAAVLLATSAPQLVANAQLDTQASVRQLCSVSPSSGHFDALGVTDAPGHRPLLGGLGTLPSTSRVASLPEKVRSPTAGVAGKSTDRETSRDAAPHLGGLPAPKRGLAHRERSLAQETQTDEIRRLRSSPGSLNLGDRVATQPRLRPLHDAYELSPVSPLAPGASMQEPEAGDGALQTLAVSTEALSRPTSERREHAPQLCRSDALDPINESAFAGPASPYYGGSNAQEQRREATLEPEDAGTDRVAFVSQREGKPTCTVSYACGRVDDLSQGRAVRSHLPVVDARSPCHMPRSLSRQPDTFHVKPHVPAFVPIASSPGLLACLPVRQDDMSSHSEFIGYSHAGSTFSVASPEANCGPRVYAGLHPSVERNSGNCASVEDLSSSPCQEFLETSLCDSRSRQLSSLDRRGVQPGSSQNLLPDPPEKARSLKRSVSRSPVQTQHHFSAVRRSLSNLPSNSQTSPGRDTVRRRQRGAHATSAEAETTSGPTVGNKEGTFAGGQQCQSRCEAVAMGGEVESSQHLSCSRARAPSSSFSPLPQSPRTRPLAHVSAEPSRLRSPRPRSGVTTPRTRRISRSASRHGPRSLLPRPSSRTESRSVSPVPASRLLSLRTVSRSLSPRPPRQPSNLLPQSRSPSSRPLSRRSSPTAVGLRGQSDLSSGPPAVSLTPLSAASPSLRIPSPSARNTVGKRSRSRSTQKSPVPPRSPSPPAHAHWTELNSPQWRLPELAPDPLPAHYPAGTAARAFAAYNRPGATCSVCTPLARSAQGSPSSRMSARRSSDPGSACDQSFGPSKQSFHNARHDRPPSAGGLSSQLDSESLGSPAAGETRGLGDGGRPERSSTFSTNSPVTANAGWAPGVLGPVSDDHSIDQPLVLDDTVAELSVPLAVSYTVAAEMADLHDR
ncbi:hypothetical protein TGVEG_260000 [Toxoplasma gondii VEG]|uniref:Uncharacterized protein n=1 Tax=Toxoplasma gondii (strain ATCC 50861 / VEG) TaxID=432359 RepID=V4ZI71_TOXGV|nr:hypothetical protein TGVEG_260000 [Toxoplasma gondii VEG]CEL74360.1 TPA: hypothetical protein BN1205_074270 [Toxoplasma gondii VEG]